ncbi:MAG: ABC transporter ATP-binding protein/permease [Actinobacteria bacterium]|nr:ABC transporter ATP-binding protein/permease [Actinomycetota bacterium]
MTEDGAAAVAVEATETRPDSWIRRLLPYLRAHRRDVVLSFGAALGGLTVTALTPVIQKIVVDDVILARRRPLGLWLGLLVAAGLVRFGAAHVRRYVGGRVALGVQYDLRNDIYTRLQRLDFARHDEFHTGQLVSRASSDVALVQGLLAFLPLFSGNVVLLVASLVIMVALSPLLTVVALLVVPVVTVIALRLRTAVFPAAWDAQQKAAEVAGVVEEAVSGVRVVKGFGQEGQELNRLVGASRALFGSHMRAVRIQAGFTSALQAVPSLGQVAVVAFGGWLALEGRISIGTFLAFSTYLLQLVSPVRMLSSLTVIAQQARAGAERIFELLDSTPVVVERPDAQDLPRGDGELRFEGVRFGYLRSEPVLADFTLTIAPHETVALVGPSGSGKSTVALLLPRFYDVQEGTVRIDGVDVRDVSLDSLRRQIGVVFEETFLFSDTVKANIAYGRPDATDAEVESAARAAEAHEFIVALPEGYNTRLGEGGLSLSGGQRQRVALARALLTDPRVLVLDDATSAIDARVEEEIHATLRRLMSGPVAGRRGLRTTLLVAHRRSTLRLADRIAVVDKGRVVDAGTHEELLARSPLYRLLLAGPGDACDEVVGPELEGDDEVVSDRDGAAGWAPGQVTASAWPAEGDGSQRAARAQASAGPPPEGMLGMHAMGTDDPGVDAGRESEPDPDFRLGRFLRPYRRALAGGLVLVVLDALASLAGPALVRAGIDRGVVDGSRAALWTVTAVFLAVTVADWGVVWAQQRVTGRTAERLLLALRIRIFAHLQRLGLDYYERELSGRIMTRMTTDVEALSQLLQTGLVNAVVSVITLAGVAVVLAVMNPQLSLVTLSTLVPLAAATVWFRRRSDRAYGTARERIATVNANLQESVSGIRVAQAYARQERNIDDFQRVARDHLDARMTAQRLVATYFPFIELLSVLAAAVVLGVGYRLAATGSLSPGELVAFLLYLNLLFSPIQQLSQVFDTYQQARASLAKIGELLATEPSVRAAYHPVEPGPLRGALRFEGVGFRYAGANEDALSEVNLDVAPGETVALVGETGAGKSTMVKLAARFYDPTEGRVLVDGIPLTDVDLGAYRRQLGYVPQEAFLFSGTIRDNIAYGHPEASDAEVEAAARAVGAHEFIARLSGGYRHVVAERGRSLSAGQRQLIALARAWLVDPAILLLDEATSTLDLATEARVVRAMGVLSSGRTTLIIAHRLQTAQGADRIVVIDKGRVVETGTHEQLLAAGTAGGGVGAPAASEEAGVGAPTGTAKPSADTGTGAYARLWGAFAAAGAATG